MRDNTRIIRYPLTQQAKDRYAAANHQDGIDIEDIPYAEPFKWHLLKHRGIYHYKQISRAASQVLRHMNLHDSSGFVELNKWHSAVVSKCQYGKFALSEAWLNHPANDHPKDWKPLDTVWYCING